MTRELREALSYSIEITRHNLQTLEYFPERCDGGTWTTVEPGRIPGHWVDGFWVGLLWLAYAYTSDPILKEAAREWCSRLTWLREHTETHDLGFIFYLSHVLGGHLTGDESLLAPAVEAAHTLTRRFNPRGEYLQAWGTLDGPAVERGRTNIDLMMNLRLLFWASEHTGEPLYARVAAHHARTSRLALVRPDGSTVHVAEFDPDSGAFLRHATHQGLSATSCWSRGQAWALYGFADAYRYSGDKVFLAVAERVADYAQQRAPEDLVPYWDYDCPDIPHTVRDSSAASVLAAGLLEISASTSDPDRAARWREAGEAIALSLWRGYSTRGSAVPAILLHGTRSLPHGMADHALIYGDYYYVEALIRLLCPDIAAQLSARPRR